MDEFKVYVEDIEPRVFADRNVALEQFRQASGRGVWAEVWKTARGQNAALKIADFPGLARTTWSDAAYHLRAALAKLPTLNSRERATDMETGFTVDDQTLIGIRGLSTVFGAANDAEVIRKALALASVVADYAAWRDGQWTVQIVKRDG